MLVGEGNVIAYWIITTGAANLRVNRTPDQNWNANQTDLHKWIPWWLVRLRVVLGSLSIGLVKLELPRWLWLLQFAVAILSDIYDGKRARRWGVATPGLPPLMLSTH